MRTKKRSLTSSLRSYDITIAAFAFLGIVLMLLLINQMRDPLNGRAGVPNPDLVMVAAGAVPTVRTSVPLQFAGKRYEPKKDSTSMQITTWTWNASTQKKTEGSAPVTTAPIRKPAPSAPYPIYGPIANGSTALSILQSTTIPSFRSDKTNTTMVVYRPVVQNLTIGWGADPITGVCWIVGTTDPYLDAYRLGSNGSLGAALFGYHVRESKYFQPVVKGNMVSRSDPNAFGTTLWSNAWDGKGNIALIAQNPFVPGSKVRLDLYNVNCTKDSSITIVPPSPTLTNTPVPPTPRSPTSTPTSPPTSTPTPRSPTSTPIPPTPTLSPLSCNTMNLSSMYPTKPGDSVTFGCYAGYASSSNSFQFRYSLNGGAYQSLGILSQSSSVATSAPYTVSQGAYSFQCSVCNGGNCTAWGTPNCSRTYTIAAPPPPPPQVSSCTRTNGVNTTASSVTLEIYGTNMNLFRVSRLNYINQTITQLGTFQTVGNPTYQTFSYSQRDKFFVDPVPQAGQVAGSSCTFETIPGSLPTSEPPSPTPTPRPFG